MATARSAIAPDVRAFDPSQSTVALDQIIAGNPALAGLLYESKVDDTNRASQYLSALGSAQQHQMALNAQDTRGKFLTDILTQAPNFAKAGLADQLGQIVKTIGGVDLPVTPDTMTMARNVRADQAAQVVERQSNVLNKAEGSGFTAVQPNGAMSPDLTMPGSLRGFVDPKTQAEMLAAQNKGAASLVPKATVTEGPVSYTVPLPNGVPGSVSQKLGNAPTQAAPQASTTGQGVQFTPKQNEVVTKTMSYATQNGLKVNPTVDKASGNLMVQFVGKDGKPVGKSLMYSKDGKPL